MKAHNIFIVFAVLTAFVFSVNLNAQEKKNHMNHSNIEEMKDSTKAHKMMHDHKEMTDTSKKTMDHGKMHDMKNEKVSIIREGIIAVKTIDMNKDGKVFQDQMCWNVISDEAGRCPKCNMKLKEVTLKHAEEKLIKNGYKTK